jgi:hypothetical protein
LQKLQLMLQQVNNNLREAELQIQAVNIRWHIHLTFSAWISFSVYRRKISMETSNSVSLYNATSWKKLRFSWEIKDEKCKNKSQSLSDLKRNYPYFAQNWKTRSELDCFEINKLCRRLNNINLF